MSKYAVTLESKPSLEPITEFYERYPTKLRAILHNKVDKERVVSHKLRRIAKRANLLPEEGDLQLLAECVEFQKTHDNIVILSNDSDFQYFFEEIESEFGIRVGNRDS